jgi:hypothetical protein
MRRVGERSKARSALEAWQGTRPSLGDRVDATLVRTAHASTTTAEPAHAAVAPASAAPAPMPMPPPAATGSWVWVALPDGTGTICARAVAWVRVTPDALSPTGWALQVSSPYWRAFTTWTGDGGLAAGPAEEHQIVPSSQVTPIPGHYETVPCQEGRDRD